MKNYEYSKRIICASLLVVIAFFLSCNKKDFLDKKPSTTLVVPTTLEDFQGLLDNDIVMSGTPMLGELSADNFYIKDIYWQNLDSREYNAYIWVPDIYQGQGQVDDWNVPYQQVFYANVILDGLPGLKVDSSKKDTWKAIKGSAYFIRAYAFYNLAQLFAPVYDWNKGSSDLGIPLRLSSDINTKSVRSTIAQTYTQILTDLQLASNLLPEFIPTSNLNRPSKPAALAMLARTCLSMGNYDQAGNYADSALKIYYELINYDTVKNGNLPFDRFNKETLYQTNFINSQTLIGLFFPDVKVDSGLYQSYGTYDLRRKLYFTSVPSLKGSYSGTNIPFSGLATDELYLIRAECSARAGRTTDALNDLNALLKCRFAAGHFIPVAVASATEALDSILVERRKELPCRGLRWTDLRRLNKEGANITLKRILNGQTDSLVPNSNLYVLPIPPDVISLSGMPQNQRP
ncbi:RagB/SusD family nutrient uptake outer membrane protein [Flavitalea flava]